MSQDAFERRHHVQRHFRGRVCLSEWDQNYSNILNDGYTIKVIFNGREQKNWLQADSELGVLLTQDCVTFKGEVQIRLEKS